MAGNTIATAYLQLVPSMKGAQGTLAKEAGGIGTAVGGQMGGGIASSLKRLVGPALLAGATAAIGAFVKNSVSNASDLGESVNALNVSFGDASAGVQALGKQAAGSLGMSNLEFNNLAVRFSAFAKNIAGEGGDVTGTLDELTTRAADFASVMNLDVSEAAQLFQSGLAGESEPLRKYGIDLSAATVQAYAYANGIAEQGEQLTNQQKVQAAYGAIMEQTAQVQGDFANTSDQLANSQRIISATLGDVSAKFGGALLPVVSLAATAFRELLLPVIVAVADRVAEFTPTIEAFAMGAGAQIAELGERVAAFLNPPERGSAAAEGIEAVSRATSAMGPAVALWDRISTAAKGFFDLIVGGDYTSALRTTMGIGEDSPLVDVILTLCESFGPLIPQVIALWQAFSPLGLLFDVLVPVLPQIASALGAIAMALSGTLAQVLPIVVQLFTTLAATFSGALVQVLPIVLDLVLGLVGVFSDALISILPVVVQLVSTLATTLARLLPVVLPVIITLVEMLAAQLSGVLAVALPIIVNLVSMLAGVFAQLLPALLPVIGALLGALLPVLGALLPPLLELVSIVLPLFAELLMALVPVIVPLVTLLANMLVPVIGALGGILEWVIGVVMGVVTWFASLFTEGSTLRRGMEQLWQGIQTAFRIGWAYVRDVVLSPFMTFLGGLRDAFTTTSTTIGNLWGGLQEVMAGPWRWIRDNVIAPFQKLLKGDFAGAFDSVRQTVKTSWDKLKAIAADPVNFVIGTVYNDGIRATFNKLADSVGLSLRLPSASLIRYAEGTEDHRAQIATGGAMRLWAEPETGGEAYIPLAESKRGRSTSILGTVANRFGYNLVPFADGGFWGGLWDNVTDVVGNIASFLSDPIAGLTNAITAPMNELLGQVTTSPFGQMIAEMPRQVVTSLIDKAVDLIAGLGGGDNEGPSMAGGWHRPSRGRITSQYGPRWGAFHNGVDFAGGGRTYAANDGRVAKTGWNVGYGNTGIGILLNHGAGLQTYYGHNPSMGAIQVRPGDLVKGGQWIGQEGATGNVTGIHLHYSVFRNGRALNPAGYGIFDDGGWLEPGHAAINTGSRPEPVFSPQQWALMEQGAGGLTREDLDYLADRIISGLAEMARGAGLANDMARNARLRTRMAGVS